MNTVTHARNWDIFCKVVDNLGDAGVCWRLSRQLAGEYGATVRLWIDQPQALSALEPSVTSGAASQHHAGVEIRRWDTPFAHGESAPTIGEVVIEAFACDPPQEFLAAMASRQPPPVWLNLEYLSAEDWVASHHRMPSPHPRLPLTKHFFFPGFTAGTGGLLRERRLLDRRNAFQAAPQTQARFLGDLGVPEPGPGALRISMFCYRASRLTELLHVWAAGARPVQLLLPAGQADAAVDTFVQNTATTQREARRGSLQICRIPFLAQHDYDRLLWCCDCNFVRGEDSLVRALWAARPLVWQLYPQTDAAHLVKLSAFLALDGGATPPLAAAANDGFWRAWNGQGDLAASWTAFAAQLPEIGRHSAEFSRRQARLDNLAHQLLTFCETRLQ